jgi:diphthine methyl ester acylhydrolase
MRTPNIRAGRKPTFVTSKPFDGGVTSLQSHHLREHIWAVGSYDSHVRLFDARNPARPIRDQTIDVEGGVWRVKWHPTDPCKLLVGAMHGGFKVLDIPMLGSDSGDGGATTIVKRFDEHESIAYGCDWDRGSATMDTEGKEQGKERLVFSCSFYDAQMHVWRA